MSFVVTRTDTYTVDVDAETLEEAKQAIYDSGRLQEIYPSCFVETEEAGEVYSSIPAVTKCNCCGKEEWERIETENDWKPKS